MSDIQEQEQDQDHTSSASEASGIIQQLNTLTDVESGLAEAHLAVENQAAQADVNSDEIAIDDDENAAAAQTDAFMAEAEKVEGALESAIPPAPSSDPRLPAQAATPHDDSVSQTATVTEAQDTIDIVNADIPAPVLPEQVAEPAHDVVMETTIEEETSPMQVDVEEQEEVRPRYDPSEPQGTYDPPQRYDPSEPQDQAPAPAVRYDPSEPQGEPAPAARYDPSEPQDTTSASYDPSVPQTIEQPSAQVNSFDPSQPRESSVAASAEDVKPVVPASSDPRFQQQPIKTEEVKTEFPSTSSTSEQPYSHLPNLPLSELPSGITEQSPSVVNNKEAAIGWRSNHKDTQALLHLFRWSIDNTEINDARAWYAVIEKDSPSATQPLLSLLKLEQALNNFSEVENLFSKAIKGSSGGISDVAVWKQYLQYIRRQNPVVEGATLSDPIRAIIIEAYDFALKDCGTDRASGEIWQDYLQFLSAPRPTNDWEEQQKQDNLRKAYQKATCIPLDNVEAIWKAYDAFENNVNKQTAKKFLAERSPAYMTARTALKDLQRLTDPLYAAQTVLPPKPTFSGFERGLIIGWKAYLKWEQENKLVIEDKEALAARIKYAMKQCLCQMRHFPELWHYVSTYYSDSGDIEEAIKTLKDGIQACPSSVLLTFACADLLEIQKDTKTCTEIYTSLIENLTTEVEDLQKTVSAEVEAAKGPEIPNAPQTTDDEINMSDQMKRLVEEREARGKMVEQRRGKEVVEIETAISISWIMFMRSTRRSEGIKAARTIFGKARRGTHLTWHLFEASAMMEFHSNKDSAVAIKIFDLGAKKFPNEVDYVIKHLQFLLSINDDTNARALFEKSALSIPAEKSRPLWDAWARYEYMYGDLAAVNKLEARFKEVFSNDTTLKRLAQRFTYDGVDQIGTRELGLGRQPPHIPMPPQMQMAPPPPSLPIPQHNTNGNHPIPPPTNYPPPIPQPQNQYRPPSPRRNRPSRSPSFSGGAPNKRQRPSPSYNPPPRIPPRDERPVNRYPSAGSGPPPPPPFVPPRAPVRASPAPSNHGDLAPALPWFIGQLPSNRSYDGPVYRPEHIIRSFDNIARDGTPLPPRGGYTAPPAQGGYAPPPPAHGGYAPPAGYGGAPGGYGRDVPPTGYGRDAPPAGYGARSQGYDYRR